MIRMTQKRDANGASVLVPNTGAPIRTDAQLRAACKASGMSLRKLDGEYRIAPSAYTFPQFTAEQREDMAYYTDDRDDAAATAADMGRRLKGGA